MTLPPYHWWRTVFFLIPAIAIYTIVLGAASLVAIVFDRRGRLSHRCAQWWARSILATTGVRLERTGAPLPPPETSCIFVANHSSIYDTPIMLGGIPRQLRIIAKAALGYVPFIGWHLRWTGHLLINRQRPGAAVFKRMQRMARQGTSLFVFPEGSRSRDGRLAKFKGGIFLLAIETGFPIVPVSITGSRDVMPKGRLMTRPAAVRMTIHEAISTAGMQRDDARALAERVRAIVASAVPGGA